MQPTRFIAVDWSGARAGEEKKIWLAEIGATSLVRLCDGWTRESVTSELVRVVHEAAAHGDRVVIGLDFSFGFPAWYARRNGWRTGSDVWRAWTHELVEQTLTAPAFPFWGRGALRAKPAELHDDSDTPPLRDTERDNARTGPRPFSVFQLVGAGAVGVGSLRGMATLRALSDAGALMWPFDAWRTTGNAEATRRSAAERDAAECFESDRTPNAVVLEIWPRLYAPTVNKSNADDRLAYLRSLESWESLVSQHANVENAISRSDDAFDALMGAMALWSAREELSHLPLATNETERVEGRIWRPVTPLQ